MKLKSYSARTHQGPHLQINEDAVEVDLNNNLFLIFDGFGGSNIGDKAVNLMKDTVKKFYTKIGGDPDSTFPFYYSHKLLIEGNALVNSMHYAHSLMKKENEVKDMNERGGASGLGVAMSENILTFASTGNCLAYIYRKGHLEVVVQPDSLKPLAGDDYLAHFHTSPLSGFGLFDDLHLQTREVKIQSGDLVLLLTDGVYSRINKKETKFILENIDLSSLEKVDEMFRLSNSRGNLDNQSAIILQF